MAIDKGVPVPALSDSPNGPAQITALAEWVDDHGVIEELTTAQRDRLPAAVRWPGRTVWERLGSGARRLVAWDQTAQQWRDAYLADPAANVAGVRTLGTGQFQAAPGNDSEGLVRYRDLPDGSGSFGGAWATVVDEQLTLPAGWSAATTVVDVDAQLSSLAPSRGRASVRVLIGGVERDSRSVDVPARHAEATNGSAAVHLRCQVQQTGSVQVQVQAQLTVSGGVQPTCGALPTAVQLRTA